MKYIYLLFLFFLVTPMTFAQFNPDAPWMTEFSQEDLASNRVRFQEIVDAFNAYWETKDHTVKGSGYKPFKRWENYWKYFLNQDDYLPSKSFLWNSLQQKKQQSRTMTTMAVSNWQPMGPFSYTNTGSWSSGQGRVNVVVVDPNNADTYFAGAPAGGVWKSTDSGLTWTPLSDDLGQIGVSGIAIDYNNSNIIYIATGDDDAEDTGSIGVWKSTDGGETWNETGLNPDNSPSRLTDLIINPADSDMLWVASYNGIYKSEDAGATWQLKQNGNFKALDIKPGDASIVYALKTNEMYRSSDSGDTFTQVTSGVPTASGRIVMDVTPANPEVVYLLSANLSDNFQGVYKSNDSGLTFVKTAQTGNLLESQQAWYDLALAVSDTDENHIFTGCLNIWRSNDGGDSFTRLNQWNKPNGAAYTHADIHYLQFYGGNLFVGSDGGVFRSSNNGDNFTDLTEGLQIGQYYRIAVSQLDSNIMVGGLQDNGGFAYSGGAWKNYYGADGMDTAIHPQISNLIYGFIQNGGNLYISDNAGNSRTGSVSGPSGETGNWVTPLEINREGDLFAGYAKLYKLQGGSFQAVSPNFLAKIDRLELDPLDTDIIYVAVNNDLQKSTDKGVSFSSMTSFSSNITSIEVNNENNSIVYVTTRGTAGKVFKSIDGGTNFTDITGNLPSIPKKIIKHRPEDINHSIFLGTNLGVYSRDDQTQTWEPFDTNLPNVPVSDLEISASDGNITAATYGRGVWRSDLPASTPQAVDIKLSKINIPVQGLMGCELEITPQVEVENNGTDAIGSFDLVYSIDSDTSVESTFNSAIAPGASLVVDLPQITQVKGFHTFRISANVSEDAFASNNSKSVSFLINSSSEIGEVNSFESSDQELLVVSDHGESTLWERGVPAGNILNQSSYGGTMAYATNLDGNYPDNTKAYLVSECYDLTAVSDPILTFDMAFDFEPDWDILYVEYSTDLGVTWQVLGTSNDPNWYNSSRINGDGVADNCYNCIGSQWTGLSSTLTEYRYDLSPFISESNFNFRFVFVSDQNQNNEGAVVDNIAVRSALGTKDLDEKGFMVYPNPTTGDVTIKLAQPSDFGYKISDITGKIVVSAEGSANIDTILVPMQNLQSGLYFLTIQTKEGQQLTKKLVKR